jgi:hypothetical protein
MSFEYPPRLGWCTKHNSTTVCKDCEIDELRSENKRYRESLLSASTYLHEGKPSMALMVIHKAMEPK